MAADAQRAYHRDSVVAGVRRLSLQVAYAAV